MCMHSLDPSLFFTPHSLWCGAHCTTGTKANNVTHEHSCCTSSGSHIAKSGNSFPHQHICLPFLFDITEICHLISGSDHEISGSDMLTGWQTSLLLACLLLVVSIQLWASKSLSTQWNICSPHYPLKFELSYFSITMHWWRKPSLQLSLCSTNLMLKQQRRSERETRGGKFSWE